MSKYTPWPWELDESSNIVKGADGSIVCADGTGAFIAIPNDADARLIAAAPELLEALRAARLCITGEALPTKSESIALIDAAISKATGA